MVALFRLVTPRLVGSALARRAAQFARSLLLHCVLIGAAALAPSAHAQVCAVPGANSATTAIAGVINSYYPGATSVGQGAVSVSIGALDTSSGGTNTAIAAGDLLLIMQMQGAQINSTNSDCYGDGVGTGGCATRTTTVASYAGGNTAVSYAAGRWEYCAATTAAGASVGVVCGGVGGGTVNAYTQSAATAGSGAYRFQVIRVPQYANVTLSGNLQPAIWNGATGGVLVVQSAGTVTMAGFSFDATARGFRGGGQTFAGSAGPPLLDPVNGTTFYSAPVGTVTGAAPGGEREGSFKGEGIAGTPQFTYNGTTQVNNGVDGYPGGSRGRGAPGNAGGGGNNQNCGGGGGGNGGLGGSGGGGWDNFSLPASFQDCGGFGGDGGTRAGNNLNLSESRLILGGGGGAAHVDGGGTNCNLGGRGGNGGGMIIVRALNLAGTGSLLANGLAGIPPNTAGSCTDGAGAGGAGGTILAAVPLGLAGRSLQANGGAGAFSSYDRHGPGGGGGGGAVYYTAAGGAPVVSVAGAASGRDLGNLDGTQDAWFSTPGATSTVVVPTTAFTASCSTAISITKTNAVTSLTAGGTTSYTVTVANLGATAVDGATVSDQPSPGLVCTVASCTATTTPLLSVCPASGAWPTMFVLPGVVVPKLPPSGSMTFVVNCNVTATGL